MWPVFLDQPGGRRDVIRAGTVLLAVAVLLGWGIGASVWAATGGEAGTSAGSAEEIRLVTGDTVVVDEQGGETTYRVRGNTSAAIYETRTGTYVIPSHVNLTRFSKELFNVEVLRNQNQTDAETASIPLIVQWVNETEMRRGIRSYARNGVTQKRLLEMLNGSAVSVSKDDAATAYRFLAGSDAVESVHYNARFQSTAVDPRGNAEAELASEQFNVTGEGVTVAVLDSGINDSHPDIGDAEVDEVNFVEGETGVDLHNHGTPVAGLITGDGTASDGSYVGVAPDADVVDVRVLDNRGDGTEDRIIEGIEYAIQQDVDVISMSLGKPIGAVRESDPFYRQVERAANEDITVVASIGNNDPRYYTAMSPGTLKQSITVGSSANESRVPPHSRKGPTPIGQYVKPDLVAPGEDVTAPSARGPAYKTDSGTSYATPLVSGAAALLAEEHPDWDRTRVKNVLTSTADPIGPQDIYAQGSGNLNVSAALDPGIVVDPATVDFGFVPTSATETRTITVRNFGNEIRQVNVSATATGIETGVPGIVSTNRSSLGLDPGESATVRLTVDTTDAREEAYSGRLEIGEASAIFGYSPKRVVTVTKRGLGEVAFDRLRLVHRQSGREYRPDRVKPGLPTLDRSDAKAVFYVEDPGEYVAFSDGDHEDAPIVTVNATTLQDGATSITLDETETISRTIYADSLPGSDGDVHAQFLSADVALTGTPKRYEVSESSPASSAIRLSPSSAATYDVRRVLTGAPAGAGFDTSAIYHLRHTVAEPTGDDAVRVDASALERQHVRYYRGSPGETYEATVGTPDFGTTLFDSFVADRVGDRFEQTIYVSPSLTQYHDSFRFGAGGWVASPQWTDGLVEFGDAESITTAVKKHPYRSKVDTWTLTTEEFDATVFPTVGQPPNGYIVDDSGMEEWTLWINGDRKRSFARPGPIQPIEESHDGIESVRLQVQDRHEMSPLSNGTVTTFAATTDGPDRQPPAVPDVAFDGHGRTNVIPNGSVDVTLSTDDHDGTVENVSLYVATRDGDGVPSSTPFENATEWERVALEETDDGSYEAALDLDAYRGTLSVALRAVDDAGNYVETTATDGVVVGSRTPTAVLSANATLVEPGAAIRFDASGSYDDLDVSTYEWDIDGDGAVDETTTVPGLTHAYQKTGTVRPALTVADPQGATNATRTASIAVSDDLPPRAGDLDERTAADVRRAVATDTVRVASGRQVGEVDVAPETMLVARGDVSGGIDAGDGSTVVVSGAHVNGETEGHNVVGAGAHFRGGAEMDGTVTVAEGDVEVVGGLETAEAIRVLSNATLVVRGPVEAETLSVGQNGSLEVHGKVDVGTLVGANGSAADIAGFVECTEIRLDARTDWELRGSGDCDGFDRDVGDWSDRRPGTDRGTDGKHDEPDRPERAGEGGDGSNDSGVTVTEPARPSPSEEPVAGGPSQDDETDVQTHPVTPDAGKNGTTGDETPEPTAQPADNASQQPTPRNSTEAAGRPGDRNVSDATSADDSPDSDESTENSEPPDNVGPLDRGEGATGRNGIVSEPTESVGPDTGGDDGPQSGTVDTSPQESNATRP